jgi:hypothetical protein
VLFRSFLTFIFLKFVRSKIVNIDFKVVFLSLWLILGISGFILRGIVSEAYVPIIYFPALALVGYLLSPIVKKFHFTGWTFVISLVLINSIAVFISFAKIEARGGNYQDMLKVTDFLVTESPSNMYKLVYLGPGDEFYTADNQWRYLLWYRGNPPVTFSHRRYIISASPYSIPANFKLIKDFGFVQVGKNAN